MGLELADEVLLVFGNPAVGTGLMQADPDVGLELPLRLLVRAVDDGCQLVFRDPRTLADQFNLARHREVLERLYELLVSISQTVAQAGPASSDVE